MAPRAIAREWICRCGVSSRHTARSSCLPAIFIAGGAGLLLGRGLLFPGWLSRRESLAAAASTAVRLVLGVIPLLVIAGLLEGFVSPTAIPAAAKFATGLAMLAALGVYLLQAGRHESPITGRRDP